MKIKIERLELINRLNKISKAISTNTPRPILKAIKIEALNERIVYTAFNDDIGIQTYSNDKEKFSILEEGVCLVFGERLINVVIRMENKYIDIDDMEKSFLSVYDEKSKNQIATFNTELYPLINFTTNESEKWFEIERFEEKIKKIIFLVDQNSKNDVLKGCDIKVKDGNLYLMATDSYKAGIYVTKIDTLKEYEFVIPGINLDHYISIVEKEDKTTKVYLSSEKLIIKNENTSFQSRIINGSYPFNGIIKHLDIEIVCSVKVDKEELLKAIDRSSVLRSDNNETVKIEIKQNKLTIMNKDDKGLFNEDIELNEKIGVDIIINLNQKKLQSIISSFDSKVINLKSAGFNKVLIVDSDKDVELKHIIMPLLK